MSQKDRQEAASGAGSLSSTEVYAQPIVERYDALIAREDYAKNIDHFLGNILVGMEKAAGLPDVLDLGAGTGRLSCIAAPHIRSITAIDASEGMLKQAGMKLSLTGLQHVRIQVADLRERLPLEDQSVDLVMAGWSICYVASGSTPQSERQFKALMQEIRRVLRPNGQVMIFETLGTGHLQPEAPDTLSGYMQELEETYHFPRHVLDTSFKFDTVQEAASLCRDFFGDEVGDWIEREQSRIVPSWTGVWTGEFGR